MAPGPLQMPHCRVLQHGSTLSCHRHPRRPRSHRRRRRGRQAGCRHSRNRLLGCQHIRTRRWRQVRCRCRTRRVHQHMDRRCHKCHRHPRRPRSLAADAEGVKLVAFAVAIAFGDVRTSALVDGARPLQMPHSSSSPTHGSTLSQMPSASSSAAQSPPQTPRASSWLPSQSQSPSGMSAHPHS